MTKAEWLIRASMTYKGQVLSSLEGNYLWLSLFMPFCNHCLHLYTAQHLVSTRETTRNACTVPNLTPNQKCHQRFEIHQRVLPWEITWCFYWSVLIWLFLFCYYKNFKKSEHGIQSHKSLFLDHDHSNLAPKWTISYLCWGKSCVSCIDTRRKYKFRFTDTNLLGEIY